MGANPFFKAVPRTDLKQAAFDDLVKDAQYDWGHAGYTGTIAEKTDFEVYELDKKVKALDLKAVESLIHNDGFRFFGENAKAASDIYDDKWGPALCFDTNELTVFCGYASS